VRDSPQIRKSVALDDAAAGSFNDVTPASASMRQIVPPIVTSGTVARPRCPRCRRGRVSVGRSRDRPAEAVDAHRDRNAEGVPAPRTIRKPSAFAPVLSRRRSPRCSGRGHSPGSEAVGRSSRMAPALAPPMARRATRDGPHVPQTTLGALHGPRMRVALQFTSRSAGARTRQGRTEDGTPLSGVRRKKGQGQPRWFMRPSAAMSPAGDAWGVGMRCVIKPQGLIRLDGEGGGPPTGVVHATVSP